MNRMRGPLSAVVWMGAVAGMLCAQVASAACLDYAAQPGRLVDLEATASRGALDSAAIACLEQSYASSTEQVTKGKISRVLLVNAYATDTAQWARLVQRHLDEVDQSDPDIAYLYAFYLYHHGTGSADVIRWSDVSLERRQVWTGTVHVSRVTGLLRLRTIAAVAEWKDLAKKAIADASLGAALEESRIRTKTFAREWLDFAREAGRDTEEPTQICLSAATPEACGLQGG